VFETGPSPVHAGRLLVGLVMVEWSGRMMLEVAIELQIGFANFWTGRKS